MARAPAAPPAAAPAEAEPPPRLVIKDAATIKAVADYAAADEAEKAAAVVKKTLKPVILKAMGDAAQAAAGNRVISRTVVEAVPGTENVVITKAMIGDVIPGKKGKIGYVTIAVQ